MYQVGDLVDWQGIPGKIIRGTILGHLVWEPDDINKFFVKAANLGYPSPISISLHFFPDGSPTMYPPHHRYGLDTTAVPVNRMDDDGPTQNKVCWHNYVLYKGFTEVYEYCTNCDDKREVHKWRKY